MQRLNINNMKVSLENDILRVSIDSHGAELQSILNLRTKQEYLWQGDSRYWGRRSPVLFPIVGKVWDGQYRMNGALYRLGQHGFARDCEFEVIDAEKSNEAWFALDWSEKSYEIYPCKFRLEIGYVLTGERIDVKWRVINVDDKPISFQIGAHPAFNYPDFSISDAVHGFFNIDCHVLEVQKIADKGCVGDTTEVLTIDENMALMSDTFKNDALIMSGGQVGRVSMLDKDCKPYLTLLFDSPVVGLWSPVSGDAPFVCIEPWWGRCDRVGYCGEFAAREYVNTIAPASVFSAGYTILIDNL